MDNYGSDYFMSQEGYASIDFTLLDRPNSNVASAPESTAALLPDLHVGDSSFASFDFLDGPNVDAFGGVPLDEAHSRDQGGYRYDLQKNKNKERSLLQQSSAGLQRGDGDPESELPSSEFQMPFEVQKPISNLDFFSQGHTKESGHQEQHAQSDPGNDATDGNHDYFQPGQMSHQTQNPAGAGAWYNSWPGSNNQGDQAQAFLQTPAFEEASDERRLMQMKGNTARLAGQMGYQSPQVPSADSVPKDTHSFSQTTHSFLPTAKQSDSRQASNMGATSSVVNKSSSRHQAFEYEGLVNGSSANQFRQNPAASVENASSARRHRTSDANVGGQDALRGHAAQSQNDNMYAGQNIGVIAPVEVSPMKVNDYDFLGGQQYGMKGQTQGEIGHQQLAVDEMQAWHQHPLLSQSNQQQTSYQHSYQDLPRHHQHHDGDRQSQQNARQQQHVQQFTATNHQTRNLGNQLSAFLTESSLQDPRVPERQTSQLGAVDKTLLQTSYPAINNNAAGLNWQSAQSDPSAMEGLAHDYLMGAGDQNFNWQALALKASQQVDPQAVYGSLPLNGRETTGQQQQQPIGAYQQALQGGTFQDYYGASGKLTAAANAQVEKPATKNLGGSESSGGSLYGSAYQPEVYDASGNLQASAQNNKHQALGKMPFWQNPYPHQAVEQTRGGHSLGQQTNLTPRSPQAPVATQPRQQRNWSSLTGQQETPGLQGGIFAQNLANAEALKQSILAGTSIQQNSRQGAAADVRPSARTQSSIDAAHYMQQQQSSSQAASGSQFLNALSTKQQQKNWNRLNLQPSVPQTAETPSTLEASQKSNWTSLNIQQASSETQSQANLNKQQNLWGGHNTQQGSSRPAAVSSLHLFTDLDGRRSNMQNSHDLQQGAAQQASKIDGNLQSSHKIQSSSVQGTDPQKTLLDLETSQQSGWRDHSLLQGTSQTNNSLQAYDDLDKTSSWRNIWQTPSSGEPSSQLLGMEDGRHQQSTLWGHSLQKSRSEAAAPINPREQQSTPWSSQDVQQASPQTDQLLSGLEAEQQGANHQSHSHSHTLDNRHHQSGQFTHLLHEDRAAHMKKTSAGVDARRTSSQSIYSLQSQVAATEQDVRHKAIQNAYKLQSQVGMTEPDSRHKANHQDVNSLQSQLRVGEAADRRPKNSLNTYNLQVQLASTEAEARHKAASQNPYNLHAQVAMGETAVRHKAASQNMYNLQSQVGMGETDARHKANHNSFSPQSHLGGAGDNDSRHRGTQNVYNNLQPQVRSVETDAQHMSRQQNVYNLQSQVVSAAEAEARLKASQNTYSLHPPSGTYSQPNSLDGRQGGSSQWPLGLQPGNSQSATSVFAVPSVPTKSQGAPNSANLSAWNASVNNVESWQKSGASGLFQQADLQQVENVDSREQKAQSGSSSRHSSPQNENHLQSVSSSRPSSRLGRPNSSLDASLSGTKSTSLSHWQNLSNHNSNSGKSSQHDVLPTWSEGHTASPARADMEKFSTGGDSTSGAADVVPQWSSGQQSLRSQQNVDQVNNLVGESNNGPNETLPTWSRGQSLPARKHVEEPTFGGESRIRSSNEAQQTSWSRGQNVLAQGQNNVEESSSGLQNEGPIWPLQQTVLTGKGAEQLDIGELNSDINEDPWSQSVRGGKEVDVGRESNNPTEDVPIWSRSQQNKSAQSVVDQLDVGEESNSSRGNEVLPSWPRGQSTPARREIEQSSFVDETSRGSDLVPSWSRGGQSTVLGGRDVEELNVEADSNMGKTDALPAWSQEHDLSRKDAEQSHQAGDSISSGTNHSVKDALNARPEAEKGAQAEMSFLDREMLRESNSAASPVPSPESNVFSSSAKQKPSTKTSSLSRNTLELLSRPEEPTESSSMNEEEMEEEELDLEDSGPGISLAHLRRPGQASGPLSPQGFGLHLAPPSHLSQKSQDASRILPTQSGQELPQSSGGNDSALNDQTDPPLPTEVATSSLQAPATSTGTAAPENSQQDSHTRSPEQGPRDAVEHTSAPSGQLEGSAIEQQAPLAVTVNPVPHQLFLGVQNSVETGRQGVASTSSPAAQGMDQVVVEDGNATTNAYGSSQANVMGHLSSSTPQMAQQHSGEQMSTNEQMQQQSGGVQTAGLSRLLSTFKDQLSGQPKQTSAQQQGGNSEKGYAGVFESPSRPQVGNKQLNGLHPPGQWGMNPSQIPQSAKVELFKRLAAQVQNKNQANFGQMQSNNNSGQPSTSSHYLSGQQQAFTQSQIFPGQQSMPSSQSQSGQPLPGQETLAASQYSRQMYNQGFSQSVQGIITMDQSSHQGYTHTQSHTPQGQQQRMVPDQQHPMGQQSQSSSGQVSAPGQSYPGQPYGLGQPLPGQVNATGRPSYTGQTHNSAPGKSFSQQAPSFGGQQSLPPGQGLPDPEPQGQAMSPAMASKQSKGRQQRKPPQKAAGKDVNHQTQMLQQETITPQQHLVQQQSSGFQQAQQSSSPAQMASHEQHHQYSQISQQNNLSSSAQASQEDTTPPNAQPASQANEGLGSKDPRAADSRGFGATDKSGPIPGNMSLEQQHGARQDNNNQGNLLQQWQNAQVLNAHSGITDFQFQRFVEARPALAASLEQYKGNPRLYQIAKSQLLASLGQAQMARQMGQLQQQARDQLSVLNTSTSAVRGPSDGSAAVQAVQASQQTVQEAQAVHSEVAAQQGQSMHPSQAAQAHAVHNAQAAAQAIEVYKAAQAAQQSGQSAHATAQAIEVYKAAQAAQQSGQSAQATAQAVEVYKAAQAAQQSGQSAQATAQAIEVYKAAQAAQQSGQSAQATAQASEVYKAAQAAQQSGQSGHSGDLAAQAVQAAIISKNANTAARLQYLSQMAQRGQSVNGMAASWYPGGMVGRPVSGPIPPSRILEGVGKGVDPTAAGAPIGTAAVESSAGKDLVQNSHVPQPQQPKKRKEPPTLPPWREVISQASGYVSNMSGSEVEWAAATNCIPEMESRDEVVDVNDSRAVIINRARRRLRLTTQLMQQITPAVPAKYMQSKSLEDRESATYVLSKLAFADACRISSIARRIREVAAARDAEESRIEKERELAMKEAEKTGETKGRPLPLPANIADRFKLRTKHLEKDLQRMEKAPSAVDLVKDIQDTERIGLVNRLAAHHSPLYSSQSSGAPNRAVPQKYVKTVQMPDRLPEGLLCVSL